LEPACEPPPLFIYSPAQARLRGRTTGRCPAQLIVGKEKRRSAHQGYASGEAFTNDHCSASGRTWVNNMDCVTGGMFSSCLSGNDVQKKRKVRSKPKTNLNSDGTLKPKPSSQDDIQTELLKGLFLMIDQNDSGSLQIEELRAVMGNADVFMSVVDTNHDDSISDEEFYKWSKEYIVCHLPDENVDRMNKLIKVALIGKRGRGAQNLDAEAVFDSLDLDGDGSLSLEELAKVLGTDAKDFLDCLDTVHKVLLFKWNHRHTTRLPFFVVFS
jgi:Ca2+-binding EF-hand superfamily protein